MSEQLDFLIELYTDFDASRCDCGGRMIPHIAHHVADEIDWSRAVGLECENRCGHTIEIAELTTVIETLVGEVTRLRREREKLAAAVQGYEAARETLLNDKGGDDGGQN